MTATGLDFMMQNNGRRCGGSNAPPTLFGMGGSEEESESQDKQVAPRLDYEMPSDDWVPLPVRSGKDTDIASELYSQWMPQRFVDGKDVGRTAAWLETPEGFPIPVRVSQIGAVAIAAIHDDASPEQPARLICESRSVEKVVAMEADFFPWHEVESFAVALNNNGFRLLIVRRRSEIPPFDFGALHNTVSKRTTEEMFRLESRAASGSRPDVKSRTFPNIPTVLDGRLEDKVWGFRADAPVVGVIKKHATLDYLHPLGGRVFFHLQPYERTPVFALERDRLSVVTWYLRTDALAVSAPNEGVMRVELTRLFFEQVVQKDFGFINALSRYLIRLRTRDSTYGRAAVTLLPIQRAEESLGSRFTEMDKVIHDFYRLTQL